MCVLIYNNGVRLSCFRATNHVTLSQIGPFGYYHYSQSLKRIYVFLCGKVLMSQTKFHIHSHEYGKKKRIQQRKKMYFRSSDCPSVVFVSPSIILFFLFLYYLCIFFYYYYSDCSEDAIEYESHLNSNATIIYSIMMMVKVRERGRNEKWEIRSTYAPPRCSLFLCCSFTYARGTLHTRTKILKKKNKYE